MPSGAGRGRILRWRPCRPPPWRSLPAEAERRRRPGPSGRGSGESASKPERRGAQRQQREACNGLTAVGVMRSPLGARWTRGLGWCQALGKLADRSTGGTALALQGTLDTFSLPDVLRLLATTAKTGRLRIDGDRGQGSVWLRDGSIVDADADRAVEGAGRGGPGGGPAPRGRPGGGGAGRRRGGGGGGGGGGAGGGGGGGAPGL